MSFAPTPLPARHAPTAETARAIAVALLEGFDRHYALFRDCARAAQAPLRSRQLARDPARRPATASTSTTAACRRRPSASCANSAPQPRRGRRGRAVGAGQAPLHRAPDRPQAARVRRDVLQLGVGQDPAPRLLPQPVHLRAAGDVDRAHRRRSAVVPQLLSAAAGPAQRADRHRPRFRLRAALRRLPAAICATCSPRSATAFPRPFRLEANHQIQVLSSPFFRDQTAYVVGRIVNGIHTYPFVVPVKHDARRTASTSTRC